MKSSKTWPTAILIPVTALLIFTSMIGESSAEAFREQTYDATADYALRVEDYPVAIALHHKALCSHPNNAIAHFHLGYAYGMSGHNMEEIREYLRAVNLGLREWDLFLNLGLAYLGEGDYSKAVKTFETSVSLGSQHLEAHSNLAIAYEKAGRAGDAMKEIITSLQIAPTDLDARNTKALICADLGDLRCARDELCIACQE